MIAAIYTRISNDPDNDQLGVQRQEADCRALCLRHGWEIADIYCDNDKSAFDPRKTRPRYQAMLDAVRNRKVDVIVAWHPDRLHRQMRELVPFIDIVNTAQVQVETVTAGRYDLSTPSGRFTARTLGSVGEYESEHRAERIRRKMQQNATDGRPHGGFRPFGYESDRRTVRESEAAVIRDAVKRLLAGESIRGVIGILDEQGSRTSTGKKWNHVTLRGVVLRPRNAGIRTYLNEPVGKGDWEPIISEADYHALHARLTAPDRRTTPGRDGQVHWLSGVARCGVCGDVVRVGKGAPYKGVSKPVYRCRSKSCVTRDKAWVDELVAEVVIRRLSRPDAVDLFRQDENDDDTAKAALRVTELRARLDDAAQAYAAGSITLAQLTTITAALEPQIEEQTRAAATPQRRAVLAGVIGEKDVRRAWESLSGSRRRALVDALLKVTILPTRKGPQRHPDSIRLEWKAPS